MTVKHDHIQVFSVRRENLVGIVRLRNGTHAGSRKDWVVEGDEGLADTGSLGFVQPLPQFLHLRFVCRPCGIPTGWRAIAVFAGPQEGEASAAEIELIDETFVGNSELFQIWKSAQQTLHVAVVPHFVIADGGENAPRQAGGAHLIVRGWQLLQHIFIHELPVRVLRRRGSLPAPPNHVAGIENELGPPSLDISYDLASDPLAAMEAENCPAHARKQFDVLDRCLSDPTLVYRQRRDFAPGMKGMTICTSSLVAGS